MGFLSDEDLEALRPAERALPRTPIPTQIVASDEYAPQPQTAQQREAGARMMALADELSRKQGLSRRGFFATAAGMAAAFTAMNEVFGPIFNAGRAEAQTPERAEERAAGLRGQFIMDMHTHFLRDDTRLENFVRSREAVGRRGWNPQIGERPQTLEDLKFANYFKEIWQDSDTKIALISSAPSDIPRDWFLTNEQMAQARTRVNAQAGAKRMYSHAIFTPGAPGWLDQLDAALELRPDSVKGYTVGDNTHKETSRYPWRMDDERVTYRGYEKMAAAGVTTVCVHKGLFSRETAARFPHLEPYADVRDVAKAAKDWPQLNFVIYHSGYRLGDPNAALAEFQRTGRLEWVSDLADIPGQHGVSNVWGDTGQIFAQTIAAQPRVAAAIMGIMLKGMGPDRIVWGSDAVWTGSPQWQIEGLRRLEIPEDMRRQHGFPELGAADGEVKRKIFGENSARLYGVTAEERRALEADAFVRLRTAYLQEGARPSHRRYGWVAAA